jgi:hypothetical protein
MAVPAKIATRLSAGLRRFQPILAAAKKRDVNESDTVVLVTDMLQYLFGYDKYAEMTTEHAIRGTFCDLAIKMDGELALLLEVKAIGLELRDQFVKQAVDYAANQGVDWVVLTNGIVWRVYKISFTRPIGQELVLELDLCQLNPRNGGDIDALWLLTKESWQKSHLKEYHTRKQVLNRFSLAALAVSSPVVEVLRRELRRLVPDTKITAEEIESVLRHEVLKREVLEGEKAEVAKRLVSRAAKRSLRAGKSTRSASEPVQDPGVSLADPATDDAVTGTGSVS